MSTYVPEIIVLYAVDGQEMDAYLSEEMAQIIEYPLSITHKKVEDIEYNFETVCENILKSNAVIMILSKEFLNTITVLSVAVFQLTKLMNPCKTILMFYCCRESDIKANHRYLLCGYRGYHRVVATHSHIKQFVINTIKLLQNILHLNDFNAYFIKKRYIFSNTPQFELSVDTVYQPNQKIYILLESAISETQRIHLSIGVSNDILIVHWKNPYTLYFTLPEFMISFNDYLEVSLICGHKHLGTRVLVCVKGQGQSRKKKPSTTSALYIQRHDGFDDDNDTNSCSQMSSLNTVFTDEPMPEIPAKKRNNKKGTISSVRAMRTKRIYFNEEDYYVVPEDELNSKPARMRHIHSTGSLDRGIIDRKYSIYDIPRSLSLTRLDSSERQVFV